MISRMDFDIFLEFQFLSQSEDFAWAIAFAWWPIFKMLSFLDYLVFFRAVFCTEQLWMICRMDFDMFFAILILHPKWGFCMGYSLCMMADFQNALIFPKFGKEMKDAPSALLSSTSTREFLRRRERFRKVCVEGDCFPHFSSVFKNSRVLI